MVLHLPKQWKTKYDFEKEKNSNAKSKIYSVFNFPVWTANSNELTELLIVNILTKSLKQVTSGVHSCLSLEAQVYL